MLIPCLDGEVKALTASIFSLTSIGFFDYLTWLNMTFSHIMTLVCFSAAAAAFPG